MLEVRLPGRLEIRLNGAVFKTPSRAEQSLLAYLILTVGLIPGLTLYERGVIIHVTIPTWSCCKLALRMVFWDVRQSRLRRWLDTRWGLS